MDRPPAHNQPIIAPMVVVVMGVSGSGKTTVAAMLAGRLGWAFQEGDDLHPRENVEKMKAGTPLTDADREPWLRRIAQKIDDWQEHGSSGVVTCSALKRSYRDIIIGQRPNIRLVYLRGSLDLIRHRMAARHGHFMPTALLDSQFSTLEEPTSDENPIVIDVGQEPLHLVQEIMQRLQTRKFDSRESDCNDPPS